MVAVDIGGTKIAVGVVDNGSVLERREVPTPRVADEVVDAVATLLDALRPLDAVGVATTGWVRDGTVLGPNRGVIDGWYGFDLRDALERATGHAVTLVNDGLAAAWGEHRFGAARGAHASMFVTVSTGVGGGIVFDGHLIRGASGLAGHVGHIVVEPDGPICGCGRRGCLEVTASGRAIEMIARAATGLHLTAKDVFERVEAGDRILAQVVDKAVARMRLGLANLQATLDTNVVVLGGGVGMNPTYSQRLEAALIGEPEPFRPHVRPALLGHDAALIGVADLARPNGAQATLIDTEAL